jgi:hypothetical protein
MTKHQRETIKKSLSALSVDEKREIVEWITQSVLAENSMSFVSPSWLPAGSTEPSLPDVNRFTRTLLGSANDEFVSIDERSELSPSKAVEARLDALLRETSLPVSHPSPDLTASQRENLDRLCKELAAMPVGEIDDGLSGRDHDEILYGNKS